MNEYLLFLVKKIIKNLILGTKTSKGWNNAKDGVPIKKAVFTIGACFFKLPTRTIF
jgi:hypothetical protein